MTDPTPRFVAIRYVGNKPVKLDNLRGSAVKWMGNGDVQMVPIEDAIVFVRYPQVWEYARDVDAPSDGTPFQETPSGPALSQEEREIAARLTVEPSEGDTLNEKFTPEQMSERVQEVIRAFPKLKRDDFGNNGKPTLPALKAILGRTVYAAERDAAWQHMQAALQESTGTLTDSAPQAAADT